MTTTLAPQLHVVRLLPRGGSQLASVGLLDALLGGIAGVVREPLVGLERDGMWGLLAGVSRGLAAGLLLPLYSSLDILGHVG